MSKLLKKGAFALTDLAITIIAISVLVGAWISFDAIKKEQKEIESVIDKVGLIVSYGIYDVHKGYTTSSGGSCSSAYDVIDITAKRVKDCTNINFDLIDNTTTDDTNPKESFFYFLEMYSNDEYGCKVYLDDFDDFTTQVFVDCSSLDVKYHSMLEQKFSSQLSKNLPFLFKTVYFDAIDFESLNDGNKDDGKIIIEFKK